MEVDAAVAILVCVFDHLFDLSWGETFSYAFADLGELLDAEGALVVFVEDFEQLLQT